LNVLPAPVNDRFTSCHYCLSVILDPTLAARRPEIMDELTKAGVGSSVYYPQPVPRMTYYKEKYGYDETLYPYATMFSDQTIALPVGPHLNANDMKTIADTLIKIIKNINNG